MTAVAETIDTELVLGTMAESGTRINVIILDACRDNPFERRWRGGGRGLAPINASDAKGTLIAYSTAPGKTAADGEGEHSPYAKALIEILRVPNLGNNILDNSLELWHYIKHGTDTTTNPSRSGYILFGS